MLYRFIIAGCCLLAISVSNMALGAEREVSRNLVYRQVSILAQLGRMLFFDPGLSASGQLSCASCHDPAHAYGPPNARPVQVGGEDLRQMRLRAVPSLRYTQERAYRCCRRGRGYRIRLPRMEGRRPAGRRV